MTAGAFKSRITCAKPAKTSALSSSCPLILMTIVKVATLLEKPHRFGQAEHQVEVLHGLTRCAFAQVVGHAGDVDVAIRWRGNTDGTIIFAYGVLERGKLSLGQNIHERLVSIGGFI